MTPRVRRAGAPAAVPGHAVHHVRAGQPLRPCRGGGVQRHRKLHGRGAHGRNGRHVRAHAARPAQLAKDDCFERLLGKDVRCPAAAAAAAPPGPWTPRWRGARRCARAARPACRPTRARRTTSWGSRRPVRRWRSACFSRDSTRQCALDADAAAHLRAPLQPVRAARRRRPRVRRRGPTGVAGVGGRDGRERQERRRPAFWARPRAAPPLWAHARRRASGTRSAPPCSSARTRRRTEEVPAHGLQSATHTPPTTNPPSQYIVGLPGTGCKAVAAGATHSPPPWPTQPR